MVSLMYVGAYIVADRYIRRYMHLPSNLPTFARLPIYRAKIVSSSKKSRKPGCRSEDPRALREARLLYIIILWENLQESYLWYSRSLGIRLSFLTFFPRENRHSLPRDLLVFARIIRARAANNDFARIHVVQSSCLIARAPDRIASG